MCGGTEFGEDELWDARRWNKERQKTILKAMASEDNPNGAYITQEEYETGYIPGAILIPHDKIEEQAAEKLPNKDQLILVYCRSGNRSKTASETLEKLGYTRIREFGGINDWPYEKEALR